MNSEYCKQFVFVLDNAISSKFYMIFKMPILRASYCLCYFLLSISGSWVEYLFGILVSVQKVDTLDAYLFIICQDLYFERQ